MARSKRKMRLKPPVDPARAKKAKRPPPWRKPEDVQLAEEIRDLERDIALHSNAPSGTMDGQTQAHDHPVTQERDEADTSRPTISRKRRWPSASTTNSAPRWQYKPVDLSQEIRDLEQDNALHPEPHTDSATHISARSARTLKRAETRIARLDAAQARTSKGKRKKSARKRKQG